MTAQFLTAAALRFLLFMSLQTRDWLQLTRPTGKAGQVNTR